MDGIFGLVFVLLAIVGMVAIVFSFFHCLANGKLGIFILGLFFTPVFFFHGLYLMAGGADEPGDDKRPHKGYQ